MTLKQPPLPLFLKNLDNFLPFPKVHFNRPPPKRVRVNPDDVDDLNPEM